MLEILQQSGSPVSVVVLDRTPPRAAAPMTRFVEVDLTRAGVTAQLAEILETEKIDAVLHAAFRRMPSERERDHALDVEGSRHLIAAVTQASVKRLVLPSSTMLYGAHFTHPSHLLETAPLRGGVDLHSVADRIEVEALLDAAQKTKPSLNATVLRFPWIFGSSYWDAVTRFFSRSMVPTLFGFDPLLQLLHEDDCIRVLWKALCESHPGCFNIVPTDVLPLSTLLRLAGKRRLSLPPAILKRLPFFPTQTQTGDPPSGFYVYLQFPWIADGERGWAEFGVPTYTTREAWSAFVSAQRLRAYGFVGMR